MRPQNLPAESKLVEFPFAATENSEALPGFPRVPIFAAIPNSVWVGYDVQDIAPRMLLQSNETLTFRLGSAVAPGFIEAGVAYLVQGFSKVSYNAQTYEHGDAFLGVVGKTEYTAEGAGHVFDGRLAQWVTTRISFFERPGETLSLNLDKYIIPTYYGSLAGILNQTKHLRALCRCSAADIESYNATRPVWLARYQHYFYVNKINEFQNGELTEVELIRL